MRICTYTDIACQCDTWQSNRYTLQSLTKGPHQGLDIFLQVLPTQNSNGHSTRKRPLPKGAKQRKQ